MTWACGSNTLAGKSLSSLRRSLHGDQSVQHGPNANHSSNGCAERCIPRCWLSRSARSTASASGFFDLTRTDSSTARRGSARYAAGQRATDDGWEYEQFVFDEVLQLVAERAQAITGADGIAIALAEGDEIICRASAGTMAPDRGVRLDSKAGFSGACFRTGKIVRCDDAEKDPRVNLEACRRLGTRSMVAVPLLGQESVVGLLEAFSTEPFGFNDGDVRSLNLLAELILAALKPEDEDRIVRAAKVAAAELRSSELETLRQIPMTPPPPAPVATRSRNTFRSNSQRKILRRIFIRRAVRAGASRLCIAGLAILGLLLAGGLWLKFRHGAHAAVVSSMRGTWALRLIGQAISDNSAVHAARCRLRLYRCRRKRARIRPRGSDRRAAFQCQRREHGRDRSASSGAVPEEPAAQSGTRLFRFAGHFAGSGTERADHRGERWADQPHTHGAAFGERDAGGAGDQVGIEFLGYAAGRSEPSDDRSAQRGSSETGTEGNPPAWCRLEPEVKRPAQTSRLRRRSAKIRNRALHGQKLRIVIDAGHGGWDLGTVGREGLLEKNLVLDVAQNLGHLLHQPTGHAK